MAEMESNDSPQRQGWQHSQMIADFYGGIHVHSDSQFNSAQHDHRFFSATALV
jgi:hypothetical protein